MVDVLKYRQEDDAVTIVGCQIRPAGHFNCKVNLSCDFHIVIMSNLWFTFRPASAYTYMVDSDHFVQYHSIS